MGEAKGARRPVLFRVPRRPALAAAGEEGTRGTAKRRKKMAVARLGGGRRRLFGAFRRLRMRWLAAFYRRALRRLRAFYAGALQGLLEGAAVVSTLLAEAAAAPTADCSFGAAFAPVVSVGGRRY